MQTIFPDGFVDDGFVDDGGVLRETTSAAEGMREREPAARSPPHLRQKFMPDGFWVLQLGHTRPAPATGFLERCTGGGGPCCTGNPDEPDGVESAGPLPAVNRVPQFRQKMDPEGLSRLQLEQLGIGPGRGFASRGASC